MDIIQSNWIGYIDIQFGWTNLPSLVRVQIDMPISFCVKIQYVGAINRLINNKHAGQDLQDDPICDD